MLNKLTKSAILLAISLLVFHHSHGQITHDITVENFQFSPASLTVQVGEEVIWTNSTLVDHNVNGSDSIFPDNPESFGNEIGDNWAYVYTFTIPGTYAYQCDVHVDMGMTGEIIVVDPTGVRELQADKKKVKVYPNPAITDVFFDLSDLDAKDKIKIKLYNALGEIIKQVDVMEETSINMETSDIAPGLYFYTILGGPTILEEGKLMVE